MPMSEEDEVFLERSFQRTLIVRNKLPTSVSLVTTAPADHAKELEKLISYSATPTAVWRRTGEVCYVNAEFCKLVSQTSSDLLVSKTYIYQLFARVSYVNLPLSYTTTETVRGKDVGS
jgi:hypothetical protein